LFFSHYFPPEVNAPATRTYEHCVRWAKAGHDVTVVTCVPNCPDGVVYPGYRNRLRRQVEFVDGVRVVRVWTYLAANAGTVRRIANYLSYMLSAVWTALWLPRPDVVVATSPQFFCGWAGLIVQWLKRVPFVLEIRDIWPESIETVGAIRNRPILRFLQWMERRMYLAADHIVAVGQGYRDKIVEKADVADRISVITNGVDLRFFVPGEPDPRFLHMWDLEDKFVCSYVGTIGMAHGLEVVLGAARLLKAKGRDDIRFCLVGDGAMRQRLEDQARRDGLERLVIFTGRQPKEEIPPILASSGACLIHLKQCELFGTVLPSKIFETMAMGRPIILGVNGEARQIVLEAGSGVLMEPDSAESLVEAVERLADDPGQAAQAGLRARQYVAEKYNRDCLAEQYLELLHAVARMEYVPAADAELEARPADRSAASKRARASSRRDSDPDGAVGARK
ncbi:MAG: glycosyltransferase family 4 protein, partial [Thermoguttaceae bacterium]|nr:glycosyltransferase family 4 protein [Thermoguttaceae bacterium]